MNDSQSHSSVVKIIKNYVAMYDVDVPVSALVEDYYQVYNREIPYSKFGHKSLVDFLITISGLSVKICDGEYHLRTRWSKNTNSCEPTSKLSPEMSLLCVEMKNNLTVSDSAAQRTVTVKEGNTSNSWNRSKRYSRSHSVKSEEYVPAFDYEYENSTTNSSLDYNPSTTEFDYSWEPNEYYADQYYSNPPDYEYYNPQWQPPYPQSSFYDSSAIYENGSANLPLFNDQSESFSSLNYNGFFSSEAVPEKINIKPPPVTEKQIVNRLVSLINAHQKKITSSAVEIQYIDIYSDTLPENWLTLLDESNSLFIEQLTSGTIIYPNRTFSTIPTMLDLPKLDLPGMPWSVSISIIRSVDSIWFRLNNLDRRYQILCQQMRKHYRDMSEKILSVQVNQLFVASFKNKLLRVCVLDRPKNGTCTCLAIDEGITEDLPLSSLMMLHEKFTNTPKLTFEGSLVGLGKYLECSHLRQKLEKMIVSVNLSVVVEKFEKGKCSMNLFVTNDSDSVNVNEYLMDVIKNELNLPQMKVDRIFDVVVLSLSLEDNLAKVQIKSPCWELLQQSLRKCGHIIDCTAQRLLYAKNLIDVQLNQLYLAKYSNGSWQRVLLKQFINSTHVVVVFVDFQDIQALEITKIICYANFPDALTYIPPQCVTVNLVKTTHEVLKLMSLRLKTNLFSMKVVQTEPKVCVQMFIKAPTETCDQDFSNANLNQFSCSFV